MFQSLKDEWTFDTEQGYTFGVKLYNALFLLTEGLLGFVARERIFGLIEKVR